MTAVFDMISSQSEAKSSEMHPRDDCQTVKNHAFIVVWYRKIPKISPSMYKPLPNISPPKS